mmetsp:Transcript_14892/g.19300  ORF Transcript_14892/g.19300 Transcript_14892/m.19300 type:complete len:270 (+) Transcript_14892:245-1054(+)
MFPVDIISLTVWLLFLYYSFSYKVASRSILLPVAAPVMDRRFLRGNDVPQSSSVLFVRKDSSFHSFSDLYQSVFAFNEENSLSGYHCMRFHIHCGDYPIPYFSRAVITGGHQLSLEALLCGEADCAAIDVDVVRRLRKNRLWRQKMMELRKVEDIVELGPYPPQPFVIPAHTSKKLVARFQKALCSASAKELKPLGWKRIVPVASDTYAPIDRLMEACKDKELICPKACRWNLEKDVSENERNEAVLRRSVRRKVIQFNETKSHKRARC